MEKLDKVTQLVSVALPEDKKIRIQSKKRLQEEKYQ